MKRWHYLLLVLLLPLALLSWLTTTASGLRWSYQQARIYLPGELEISGLEGSLIGPIRLQNFTLTYNGTQIEAGPMLFDWRPGALLRAEVDISQIHLQGLHIKLADAPAAEETGVPLALPEIRLPWRTALDEVQIDDFSLSRQGQVLVLQQLRLRSSTLLSKVEIRELSVRAERFRLNLSGELRPTRDYRHQLAIAWQVELPTGAPLSGSGQLSGDMQRTHLTQQVSGPLALSLDAKINDVLKQLRWQTEISISAFDLPQLAAGLPALSGASQLKATGDLDSAELTGTLDGQYADLGAFTARFELQRLPGNSIQLEQLALHIPDGSSPDNSSHLTSHGTWTPGDAGGEFALALDWQNLHWPLQGPAWFNSASGSGSVAGNFDRYRLSLNSDSPWPEHLPSRWTASAEGDRQGLSIESLRVTALEGEAVASGRLDWSPALNWRLKVRARDINPASLWPNWPGQLHATATSHGHLDRGQLVAEADIDALGGELRAYPVSLQGQLAWRNGGLDLNRLDAGSGESQFSAQGRLAETLQLSWNLASDNLAELYPQAEGQLHASGRLSGPRTAPTIQASFKGQALTLPDYRIGTLDGQLDIDLSRWQQLEINLSAQALKLHDYTLQSLNISSSGQQIELKLLADDVSAQARLDSHSDAEGWHGRLQQVEVLSRLDHWQLKAPVSLDLTEKTIQAEPLCVHSAKSEICLNLHRQDTLWQAKFDAVQAPLRLFAPWLPADLIVDGRVNASAGLQLQTPAQLSGQGQIELLPGSISYPLLEGERELWDYRGGTLRFALNKEGVSTSAEITLGDNEHLRFMAALPGAQLLALDPVRQKLHAEAQLSLSNLGLIEALLPDVQDLEGKISLNLAADGTLAEPQLSGKVRLRNGHLRVPGLGLNITRLNLSGQSEALNKFGFRLQAHSGDGDLSIEGQTRLSRADGWPTSLTIKGEDFEAARIPEAMLLVSPNLQIEQGHRNISLRGEIHIPYARLQPREITTAARVSEDAVIIGGEKIAKEKWLIDTQVRLTLGERVHFYGFGFEGRLGGSLLLEDKPGQLTRATGEINIPEGRYRAYGQRLEIELGRLLFTGGPPTNPGLDLRAVRHVEDITAGIKVRGSLKQPQLELFSTPAMDQTDMLAYLLLGAPIESASGEQGAMMAQAALALGLSGGDHLARTIGDRFGLDEMRIESSGTGDQASLVVGRYLSPRLYVSYGVGLIETFNTLSLRYKISSKWQLKAESGEYHGADFMYTIER